MEITGKIIAVLDARGGVSPRTGSPWKIQEYVLETINEQFPRRVCFNVFGEEKIAAMNIQKDEEMTVYFDINAREYQGRWFNDIRAWKVDRNINAAPVAPVAAAAAPTAAPAAPTAPAATTATAAPVVPPFEQGNEADDLPF